MSTQKTVLPKGLISFSYNAIYDPATNEGALLDLDSEMSKFELTEEAKKVVAEAQSSHVPNPENNAKLIELLSAELTEKLKTFEYSDL